MDEERTEALITTSVSFREDQLRAIDELRAELQRTEHRSVSRGEALRSMIDGWVTTHRAVIQREEVVA